MTPQERLDALMADVWQPTDAVITVAEIVATVGMDAGRLVVGTLQSGSSQDPILAASYQAITTVGMSLSSPERQGLVDALATAGQWPDAVTTAVKALGGVYVKEWQRQGMAEAPTLESVQATIDAENLATQLDNLQTRFDAIKNQIGTVEQADAVVALRVMADELGGV